MNQLPTCLDINAECDNEPCVFHHDHKCTFHCRQWRHVNTGYQNQSERDKVLEKIEKAHGCLITEIIHARAEDREYQRIKKAADILLGLKLELRQKAGE